MKFHSNSAPSEVSAALDLICILSIVYDLRILTLGDSWMRSDHYFSGSVDSQHTLNNIRVRLPKHALQREEFVLRFRSQLIAE
jgi:hypothetical protein